MLRPRPGVRVPWRTDGIGLRTAPPFARADRRPHGRGAEAADRIDAALRRRGRPGAARGRHPRRAARADRDRDVALPAVAIGVDPGAVGDPAPLRLVHAGRHSPGGGGDGRDPGLPGVGRVLLRPLRDLAGRHPPGLVCTNISCWMRGGDELLESFCEAAGADHHGRRPPRRQPRPTASSSSRGSSAWAPATWRRWPRSTSATTVRSRPPTPSPRSRRCETARRRPTRRRSAGAPLQVATSRRRTAPGGDRRCLRRGFCSATSTSRGWRRSTGTGPTAATRRSRRRSPSSSPPI